jgi:hypothetical protein
MRKNVRFDRPVRIMVPIWHQGPIAAVGRTEPLYNRPMTELELPPGVEYKCADIQSLINKGAVIHKDDYMTVCSSGFIPEVDNLPMVVRELTTGLDPEEELH